MMKSVLSSLFLLSALVFCFAGMGSGGGVSGDKSLNYLLDRPQGGRHPFTDAQYLEPQPFEPTGTICLMFDDGDSSFASFFIPVCDSIRESKGRFADVAYAGADIRGTVFIEPVQTTSPRTAERMSVEQVKANSNRQKYYEFGAHGDDSERLGPLGLDSGGAQVSFGGVTGMQYAFVDTLLEAYQDSAQAWGIPAFRSYGYTNWKQTLGMETLWRKHGFFQCKSLVVNVGNAHSDVSANEQTGSQRNNNPFAQVVFEVNGLPRYAGYHTIGEPINSYDIGSRGSFSRSGFDSPGVPDTVMAAIDIACQLNQIFLTTFHNIVPSGGSPTDLEIEQDEMYELLEFIGHRITEGVLISRTFEQVVQMMRGYRVGDLIGSKGFRLLSESTITTPWASQVLAPIGFMPAMGQVPTSEGGFYTSATDTFVASGGAAGSWKVWDLVDDGDTLSASEVAIDGDATQLTYGFAKSDGNILIQQGATTNSDNLVVVIQTTGCRARYIDLTVQTVALNDPTPTGWATNFYMSIKAGQFRQLWHDNINSHPNAVESMKWLVHGRNNPANFTSWNREAQMVVPQFSLGFSDTSATGEALTAWIDNTTPEFSSNKGLAYWISPNAPFEPYIFHDRTLAWDLQASWGNYADLAGAGNAQSDHDTNWQPIDTPTNPNNHYFQIPINQDTDYVYANLSVERLTTTLSANMEIAITHISATPRQ